MNHGSSAVFCKGLGLFYFIFLIRKALRLIASLSASASDTLSSLIHEHIHCSFRKYSLRVMSEGIPQYRGDSGTCSRGPRSCSICILVGEDKTANRQEILDEDSCAEVYESSSK